VCASIVSPGSFAGSRNFLRVEASAEELEDRRRPGFGRHDPFRFFEEPVRSGRLPGAAVRDRCGESRVLGRFLTPADLTDVHASPGRSDGIASVSEGRIGPLNSPEESEVCRVYTDRDGG
jgi:hypothetical protein